MEQSCLENYHLWPKARVSFAFAFLSQIAKLNGPKILFKMNTNLHLLCNTCSVTRWWPTQCFQCTSINYLPTQWQKWRAVWGHMFIIITVTTFVIQYKPGVSHRNVFWPFWQQYIGLNIHTSKILIVLWEIPRRYTYEKLDPYYKNYRLQTAKCAVQDILRSFWRPCWICKWEKF